jgi:GTP pyrophosphokinase
MAVAVHGIEDLLRKVRSYNPGADLELIRRAYWLSAEAHGQQRRREGTPYIEHPLAVASILADMKMDTTSIAAGLLHDTLEDTRLRCQELQKLFGRELAFLVEAVTKLSRLEFRSREEAQAENFRKMLLSMAEDVRVIMVKFADRLHNMRTLEFLPPQKRQKVARETLEIYAPLAHRLGIGWLRCELEDLSFKHLMPELYKKLVKRVAQRRERQEGYMQALMQTVKERLAQEGLTGTVAGRVKHYWGIYQKMQRQGITFDQVHDVLGIRVITDTKASCYAILGLIHSLWKPVPGKFKDYIGVPKSNMYQSLHTTVIGPEGRRVEFQIRTHQMHRLAEEGIAAHWRYKEGGRINPRDDQYVAWLRNLLQELQQHSPRDFLEAVKAEVVPETIYVFTPKGDIKELPQGATPVDFAYSIHTEVGHQCIGARVNGKMVPLRYQLKSGDTVEVITSQSHGPSRDWLSFVATQRARTRIRQWIKAKERQESLELGQRLLEAELRRRGAGQPKAEDMARLSREFNFQSPEDLVVAIGYGKLSAQQVLNRLQPQKEPDAEVPTRPKQPPPQQKGITITGMDNILYSLAKCCYPIPGDPLVGLITRGRGVSVHRRSCPNLARYAVDDARLIEVTWDAAQDTTSHARLSVETVDRPGILASLSAVISAANVNIHHLEAHATQDRRARIQLILEVRDRAQLQGITQKILQVDGVLRVRR